MIPVNNTQTIKAELSERFCQMSAHQSQMAERAKGKKETDDRKGKKKRVR